MADETVNITINTKAKTKGIDDALKGFAKMREMGEKISQIGTKISMVFTAPVAGIAALLMKNERFAASFKPIGDALGKIVEDMVTTLIPVIKDLTPMILDLVKGVSDLVKKFAGLSTEQKETILKWVGLAALLGPLIFGVGQLIGFIGTLGLVFGTALAPILAVGTALFALLTLVQMDEFKKAVAIIAGLWTTGDKNKRALITAQVYKDLGGGQAGGTATGDFVRKTFGMGVNANAGVNAAPQWVVNYSPALSTASAQELQKNLGPIIADVLRQQQGR